MKLVKLYESVIIEGKAQSCLVKFGKELFDSKSSMENDIDYLKLINDVNGSNNVKMIRPKFIDAIRTLKGCISNYPEVLQPDGVAYRGVNIPLSELLGQYEDISNDLDEGGIFDFIYTSPSIIQNWSSDKDTAENFTKISPFLLQYINQYNKVSKNPNELRDYIIELSKNINNISVPIVITLNTNSDDFLLKGKYFTFLSEHEDGEVLIRVNNQPTKVSGKIINQLFKPVYGMLKSIRKYNNGEY